jgi:hypothetical protein
MGRSVGVGLDPSSLQAQFADVTTAGSANYASAAEIVVYGEP